MPDYQAVAFNQHLLAAINQSRELLLEHGMGALGAWALLNLLVSGYFVAHTDKRTELHYFHQMNVGWNFVNALLAVAGVLRAHPNHVEGMDLATSLTDQFTTEKILLFNAGLDVAYLACGSWLRARAASSQQLPERLLGFGRSLWLQGGFLFLFDLGFYLRYHSFAAELLNLLAAVKS
ncbi:DUF6992 family protein [Hymenobacter cavernae]|uniref:DUF2243 domain-containing protein n=1 Tax=Hymenobacter cavernae TaxID=2044852 RepID=A0ABQ1TQU7_9BACT|nr:hypothetical protein [Hymenobacter cavernae]GGE99891.1 hypothetical protein GCM10011383_08450 [Hymenobacter cavernae]